jgi:hypothetical protein
VIRKGIPTNLRMMLLFLGDAAIFMGKGTTFNEKIGAGGSSFTRSDTESNTAKFDSNHTRTNSIANQITAMMVYDLVFI